VKWDNEDLSVRIKQYIDENLDKPLTSAFLCRYFFISRTKLFNLAQRAFGTGIGAFIKSRRIEKATDLLLGGCTVSDAARAVGIPDYNYFCKLFKKTTGISPGTLKPKIK
ncbi:MAG: AraC family transcriptional regulator, partial [Clostridiales bacterium]|nr:AraC family transcriptional regulator [Clostridiales bacterium]